MTFLSLHIIVKVTVTVLVTELQLVIVTLLIRRQLLVIVTLMTLFNYRAFCDTFSHIATFGNSDTCDTFFTELFLVSDTFDIFSHRATFSS